MAPRLLNMSFHSAVEVAGTQRRRRDRQQQLGPQRGGRRRFIGDGPLDFFRAGASSAGGSKAAASFGSMASVAGRPRRRCVPATGPRRARRNRWVIFPVKGWARKDGGHLGDLQRWAMPLSVRASGEARHRAAIDADGDDLDAVARLEGRQA